MREDNADSSDVLEAPVSVSKGPHVWWEGILWLVIGMVLMASFLGPMCAGDKLPPGSSVELLLNDGQLLLVPDAEGQDFGLGLGTLRINRPGADDELALDRLREYRVILPPQSATERLPSDDGA